MGQIPMLFTLYRLVDMHRLVYELYAPAAPPRGWEELAILRCTFTEEEFIGARLLQKLAEALARFSSLRGKQLTAKLNTIGGNYSHPLAQHYRDQNGPATFNYRIMLGFQVFERLTFVGFINLYCLTPDWPQHWPLHHGGTYPINVPVAVASLVQVSPVVH